MSDTATASAVAEVRPFQIVVPQQRLHSVVSRNEN
jgi:hypothetical protein